MFVVMQLTQSNFSVEIHTRKYVLAIGQSENNKRGAKATHIIYNNYHDEH